MNIRRIEEATFNAWPALTQILYDGWLLRFAGGYTRRANSVNALYHSSLEIETKVDHCERVYHERGQPCIYRLTPLAPAELDRLLDARGYQQEAITQVLAGPIVAAEPELRPGLELRDEKLDTWLAAFDQFNTYHRPSRQVHRAILEAIPGRRLLALLLAAGKPVALGLAVLEGAYLGLYDLVTDTAERRRGYGTELVKELLRWGATSGAQYAYLQVMMINRPALALYAKLGFTELYRYWYRVPSAGS